MLQLAICSLIHISSFLNDTNIVKYIHFPYITLIFYNYLKSTYLFKFLLSLETITEHFKMTHHALYIESFLSVCHRQV